MSYFESNLGNLDRCSTFINSICKLIYDKHNGNLDSAIIEVEQYFDNSICFIKGVYDLIDTEIPLYAYYILLKYGAENYGLNESEYQHRLNTTRTACIYYYS